MLFLMFGLGPACPADMVLVEATRTCVDRYEWPNVKGVRPAVAMTAVQSPWDRERGDDSRNAEALCASVGKRMCSLDEWVPACRGEGGADYPFGRELPERKPAPDDAQCNYAQHWRERDDVQKVFVRDPAYLESLNQSDPSGERGCVSASGAEDMMGNVEEWVTCPAWTSRSKDNCVGDGDDMVCYCLAGRYWSGPAACDKVVVGHAATFHDYQSGTRCCKSPEYARKTTP